MKRKAFQLLLYTAFILFLTNCDHNRKPEEKVNPNDYKESLMEANRHVVKTEAQHIDDFLRRYKWNMKETGSGLKYMIYEEGSGPPAEKWKTAVIEYSVRLITGDIVYSSEKDGLLSFLVGKGEVISGLEEGILLMNVGDEAKFIIPSHLAFGLVGDDHLIPRKASLIYDVKLLEIK
ncbi:MAG: FKBP-type peptidyl-prolyl cis-trans isomerase [Bacteroidales bacterium]|nr:FKBP-type peptidyl-prolyl cis-trans isomerase [Bacteroidales bacterium]